MSAAAKPDDVALADLEQAITAGVVRIEFGIAFGVKGSIPTATLYTQNERGRWVKVSPFITPKAGGDRGDLLDMLAVLYRQAATR